MDTNASTLLKQVRQFSRATAAQDNTRLALHRRQARTLGLSDKEMQRRLAAMGMDVPALLKDTETKARALNGAHKAYFALPRPPVLPGGVLEIPPDPNVFDVRPPAIDGFGTNCSAIDRGLNLPLGEMNIAWSEQGDGWGWQATAGSTCFTTLVFEFTPPRAGNVQVDAWVDCQGQFAISANDHWWSSTSADLTLSVSSRLYQHYWEFGPSETLIDEHRSDSSNSGWISQMVKLSYTTSLSANNTVLIFVEVSLDMNAHSSYAEVDVDFKTGAERHIRVPAIRFTYI